MGLCRYSPRNVDDELRLAPRRRVSVTTGTDDLLVELPLGARVRGQLVDASSRPVPGGWVRAKSSGTATNDEDLVDTDAKGRFDLVVPAGSEVDLWAGARMAPLPTDSPPLAHVAAGATDVRLELPPSSASQK